jgi:hypothetical protein
MASRPRDHRGLPHGFMQHHAKEWLAAPAVDTRLTET